MYDITEFVVNHPGGKQKIMLAAGKDIGPFWRVYQQHRRVGGLPLQLLEQLKIGRLDPEEPPEELDQSDPYATDPERHPGLVFHNSKPANAELPVPPPHASACAAGADGGAALVDAGFVGDAARALFHPAPPPRARH